jgi:hypothetical protein
MKGKVNQVDVQLLFLKHFVGKRNTDYRYCFDLAALEQVYLLKFHMLEAFIFSFVEIDEQLPRITIGGQCLTITCEFLCPLASHG